MKARAAMARAGVALAAALAAATAAAQAPQAQPASGFEPLLVVYSAGAATAEGDPDYRQIVYIALDEDGPARDLWVYDPDTAGAHDSAFAPGQTSLTEMRVVGGPDAYRGPVEAEAEAALLDTGLTVAAAVFGRDPAQDARWVRLARLDPAAGAPFGAERVFRFQAIGREGVEGNIFDLRLGDADGPDLGGGTAGARLFTYDLGLRAATPQTLIEIGLTPPAGSDALVIRNFDSGGGVLTHEGPFETRRLRTSGNDLWTEDRVELGAREGGTPAAIRFFGGRETPNDWSLSVRAETAAGASRRVALGPPRALAVRNARPKAEALAAPVGCRAVRLDGRLSQDQEEAALGHRWILPGLRVRRGPVALVGLPGPGVWPVRLEVDDGSGASTARAALDFEVHLRAPPNAVIDIAPETVAPGEPFRLSGARSTPGVGAPDAAFIERYVWTVDGAPAEGVEVEARLHAPGRHAIRLSAIADGEHPCREGVATATVRVNAPPLAEAGPDRSAAVGELLVFDGGASRDPDGVIRHYRWDFGDGRHALGPRAAIRYETPGARIVTLTVVDDSGVANAAVRDTLRVDIHPAPNAPPVPRIAAPSAVTAGVPVAFDASSSDDPDGRLLSLDWRFGNGSRARGPAALHTFFAPGRAEVDLLARDAGTRGGGRARASAVVAVADRLNDPPVAVAGPDRTAQVGERLVFDAAGSRDPDGAILAYRWRFEPGVEARGPVVTHAFQSPGRYSVRLEVEDDHAQGPARVATEIAVTVRPAGTQ